MATTRAIAATGETITNTETYVSSALTVPVKVTLPSINDGSGATVAVGTQIEIESTTQGGVIEVLNQTGRRVHVVQGMTRVVLVAQAGTVQAVSSDQWLVAALVHAPVAFVAAATRAGTGSTVDAESRAAIDLLILENACMKSALIKFGLVKAQ